MSVQRRVIIRSQITIDLKGGQEKKILFVNILID